MTPRISVVKKGLMTDVIGPLRLTQAEEGEVLWRTSQEFVRRPPGCSEILKSAESARFAAGSESPLREDRRGDVFTGWGATLWILSRSRERRHARGVQCAIVAHWEKSERSSLSLSWASRLECSILGQRVAKLEKVDIWFVNHSRLLHGFTQF